MENERKEKGIATNDKIKNYFTICKRRTFVTRRIQKRTLHNTIAR
tara:strand:- start:396 stop:530 length:135 start_codon:yes stop_codon:yes gene_type:complete